jgi:hypothetical protein
MIIGGDNRMQGDAAVGSTGVVLALASSMWDTAVIGQALAGGCRAGDSCSFGRQLHAVAFIEHVLMHADSLTGQKHAMLEVGNVSTYPLDNALGVHISTPRTAIRELATLSPACIGIGGSTLLSSTACRPTYEKTALLATDNDSPHADAAQNKGHLLMTARRVDDLESLSSGVVSSVLLLKLAVEVGCVENMAPAAACCSMIVGTLKFVTSNAPGVGGGV